MKVTLGKGDFRISLITYLAILAAMILGSILIKLGVNFYHHEPGGVFTNWWYYSIPAIMWSPFEMIR